MVIAQIREASEIVETRNLCFYSFIFCSLFGTFPGKYLQISWRLYFFAERGTKIEDGEALILNYVSLFKRFFFSSIFWLVWGWYWGQLPRAGVWSEIPLIFSSVWVLRNCRKIEENNFMIIIIIIFLLFRTF